jgi:AhpD family alkylhydroperoxidase
MNKIIKRTQNSLAVFLAVFVLSIPLFAQEKQSDDDAKKVQTEMEQAFGTFPTFMKVFPEHLRAAAWEMEKARQNPEAAIPAKYSELIALAVASQIPCNYCVYYHTETAKMLGATEAELRETVATAAYIRHWSTILNGAAIDFEAFKAEFDQILAYIKKQSEAAGTSK